VRVTAATALGERFWRAGAGAAATAAIDDTLLARTHDPDAATRVACARALMRHRTRVDADLSWMLDDPDPVARAGALRNLALLEARDVTPLLLARLGPERPLAERMAAEEALGALGDRGAAEPLRARLADDQVLVVAGAADALGTLGDSASVPALTAAFERWAAHADADARLSIRDALRALAGRAFADSLERVHPAANALPPAYAPDFAIVPTTRGAVLHTTKGDITWAFEAERAPQTVRNFTRLAARGYFDGLMVHRVVPDFVIQDGDPTGTGAGGPGWTIRCEYNRLRYGRGMVGMALSGKDTGGSQWFITHAPQPHLDGRYTIFARVTRGMDVVDRIVPGDRVLKVELLR
jgi:cyclophilin family peptidyl-prolyl cis-trans isomerase